MLTRARASRETAAAIEWRVGSATDMPFVDATFDCVTCQHGLQFIPDKVAALSEMHRVLADRGLTVYQRLAFDRALPLASGDR